MTNVKHIIGVLLVLTVIGNVAPVLAVPGESIVFNPNTGNYLITYLNEDDSSFYQVTFVPSTKINPTLRSRLRLDNLVVQYGFTLVSGRDSQQNIYHIILDPISSVATNTPIPPAGEFSGDMTPAWMNSITDSADAMIKAAKTFDTPAPWKASFADTDGGTFRLGWTNLVQSGMPPGGRADFGFKSLDLPGIVWAQIRGYAPASQEIPGEQGPDPNDGGFGQQYTKLLANNFVPRPAAVPAIAVPAPFDAAILLDRIQTQMHTWIGMKLLDPTFSSQLDRNLAAAADAYRHGQPKAAKEDIEQVREMLKKEHPDMGRDEEHESAKARERNDDKKPAVIDLLAARVLDFNLAYVLKRAEEGKEGKGKD